MGAPLAFEAAKALVLAEASRLAPRAVGVPVALDEAAGRVLAADVHADRDQPPFDRSTRDGFAVRAAAVAGASEASPVLLRVAGEIAAGAVFAGSVPAGAAVEIMTGAARPEGVDAVVMVEHTKRPSAEAVQILRSVAAGENFVPQGSELRSGAVAVPAGTRLDPAAIGLLAGLGCGQPRVFARPRVAVISTGDEIVPIDRTPEPVQIRNSNQHMLAAQIRRAGGEPLCFPIAPDDPFRIEALLREAFSTADLVLATGGVSMGKHDHVEEVLARLGMRTVFDGVAIRPGRPVVFGLVGSVPFLGLPGNPLSASLTFELFARPLLAALSGQRAQDVEGSRWAPLAQPFAQRPLPLRVFVPAQWVPGTETTQVLPLPSQGSGDLVALARGNAWMVVPPGVSSLAAGTLVELIAI